MRASRTHGIACLLHACVTTCTLPLPLPHAAPLSSCRACLPLLSAGCRVEIMRIDRIDLVSHSDTTTCTLGQVWMYLAPGSGIWYNLGRSKRVMTTGQSSMLWWSLPTRPCSIAKDEGCAGWMPPLLAGLPPSRLPPSRLSPSRLPPFSPPTLLASHPSRLPLISPPTLSPCALALHPPLQVRLDPDPRVRKRLLVRAARLPRRRLARFRQVVGRGVHSAAHRASLGIAAAAEPVGSGAGGAAG